MQHLDQDQHLSSFPIQQTEQIDDINHHILIRLLRQQLVQPVQSVQPVQLVQQVQPVQRVKQI